MTDTPENDKGTTRTPRWVKVFGIIALLVIVLVVVLVITGRGGPHSPRRHGLRGQTAVVTETSAAPLAGLAQIQA